MKRITAKVFEDMVKAWLIRNHADCAKVTVNEQRGRIWVTVSNAPQSVWNGLDFFCNLHGASLQMHSPAQEVE